MQLPGRRDEGWEPTVSAKGIDAGSSNKPTTIVEWARRPDFPQCTVGQWIDIRGYTGLVTGVVHNSIKVRSAEGTTQSFNFHRLRTLYGPVTHPEPVPNRRDAQQPSELSSAPPPAKTKRELIAEPDYTAPLKPIQDLVGGPDFPRCAFGQHVDIAGFKGVVVEIANQSLKVRTPEGITRSYNASGLRNLYGQA
jgi:hypothetical protein